MRFRRGLGGALRLDVVAMLGQRHILELTGNLAARGDAALLEAPCWIGTAVGGGCPEADIARGRLAGWRQRALQRLDLADLSCRVRIGRRLRRIRAGNHGERCRRHGGPAKQIGQMHWLVTAVLQSSSATASQAPRKLKVAGLCSPFVLGWRETDESMSDDSGESLPIS